MPPVFGPVSPSKAALWSCVGGSGTMVRPDTRARMLSSSPSSRFSITTCRPASRPNSSRTMMRSMAASASSFVEQTTTPLPAARPSALTTTGYSRVPM